LLRCLYVQKRRPYFWKPRLWLGVEKNLGNFKEQIEAHIHHIRHLTVTAKREHLTIFGQLVLTAPSLELLFIGDQGSQASYSPVIILTKCVELGIPLRTLDLRTCTATNCTCAVQLLSEIVVDVLGPMKNESGDLAILWILGYRRLGR
jgi:hypothetical protein